MELKHLKSLNEKLSTWTENLIFPPTRIGFKLWNPDNTDYFLNLLWKLPYLITINKLGEIDANYYEAIIYGKFDAGSFINSLPKRTHKKRFIVKDNLIYIWIFNNLESIGNFDVDTEQAKLCSIDLLIQ